VPPKRRRPQIAYFIGPLILLAALIYIFLNYHYGDKGKDRIAKDRIADEIVHDRYERIQT
jgi:hypothetical protein